MDATIIHHFCDGVYAREQRLLAGQCVDTHAHKHDHLSIMIGGPVEVTYDDICTRYTGIAVITIKSGIEHRIIAVGDSTWFCIHATDEADPAKIEELLIVKG